MFKFSNYWNTNWPSCFKGNNYSQPKGRLLEGIRSLERQIENLEKENKNQQEKINFLENQLKISNQLKDKTLSILSRQKEEIANLEQEFQSHIQILSE